MANQKARGAGGKTSSGELFNQGIQLLRELQGELLKFLDIKEKEVLARMAASGGGSALEGDNPSEWLEGA